MARVSREHPGVFVMTAWSYHDPSDPEVFAAVQQADEPLTALLWAYGLVGDDLTHWRRVIWASVQGFVSLRSAGVVNMPADSDESLELPIALLGDGLERVRPAADRRAAGGDVDATQ